MKKKLLFIINTMGRAGAETALIELLKKLDAADRYELSLYAMIPRGELFGRVPERVRLVNGRVSCGSVLSPSGRLSIFLRLAGAFFYRLTGFRLLPYLIANIREQKKKGRVQYDKLMWRVLAEGSPRQKERYDLAVAFIEGASAYYLADKVQAAHKAAFIHIDYQRAGYLPMMDRNCYDAAERVFVVSREVGEKFCAVYPRYRGKVRLFRNLLDVEGIRKKAEEPGFDDGFAGVRLVTVGRLTYQKGYDVAVEATARMVRDGYPIRWYVFGDGPEKARLERLIDRFGVGDRFLLMGAVDNPYPFMRQADIYVHATRFEGKSIAIEEAQILGKTIAASDCTGNTEQIVSGADGVLFPLSAQNLAKNLEYLIDHPEFREELARHVREKRFHYPEDLEHLLELMEQGEEAVG